VADNAGNAGLFCDLVGTLVAMDETRQLPVDADGNIGITLLPQVKERLVPLRDKLVFVVSNQAGISRGRYRIEKMEQALAELDQKLGGILTAWEICPHEDAEGCGCRKPKPGMIESLAVTHGVDLSISTMVGDQEIDLLAARAAGIRDFVFARDFFGWS
jgi:histidinol-phosphate phosphatase family protein